jgi:hypothetical protein
MTNNEHLQQLNDIRDIMEKSSRFISLSGLSGVFAGFFALIGAGIFYNYCLDKFGVDIMSADHTELIVFNFDTMIHAVMIGSTILVLSIGCGIFFTTRKAKRKGLQIWHQTTWRLLINLAIPLITGGIFCLMLMKYGLFCMVGPCTLIFYGLALLNGSKYTLEEVRYLGISEIILGLISMYYIGFGIIFWVIGFGFLHIVYGWYMYRKHG